MAALAESASSSGTQSRDSLPGSRRRSAPDEEGAREALASDELSSPDPSRSSSILPTQKRRRVTRACDECRRKKIKCDGKQPCTHCTVYSYDCTYDQPSHRRRNPGPQYVEALEQRLQRAEAVLRSVAPGINLDDAGIDASLKPSSLSTIKQRDQKPNSSIQTPIVTVDNVAATATDKNDPGLESMVKATGHLDLDESGDCDYYGHSSGIQFLREIKDQFGNALNQDQKNLRPPPAASGTRSMSQDFSSPKVRNRNEDSPYQDAANAPAAVLPMRDVARQLCVYALDDGGSILHFVYKPQFYTSFDRIYDLKSDQYESQDEKFLPMLYATMALGCLFAKDEEGYESATDKGFNYFWAARHMMDITECRDIVSLQAIIFMIMFLQSSARLSTCYSYLGIALRAALRMGLHRSFRDSFNPIEAEIRKRTFWVLWKMDVYVGAMLGLPLSIGEEDFDQDMPTEIDDEYITETGLLPMPAGTVPSMAAANANFRLGKLLRKIVKTVYPIKGFQNTEQTTTGAYSIRFGAIRQLETELQIWKESLPDAFQPGGMKQPSHVGPMQQLLRMAYGHAQMMLYRPFLHYVSSQNQSKPCDPRSYACAAACVSVSRNIVHITTEMMREGLLIASYWFTMYTAFFAVSSLLYFAVENPDNPTTPEIMRDAKEGKATLALLADRSMAAARCSKTLEALYETVAGPIEKGTSSETMVASKKRAAPAPPPTPRPTTSGRKARSQPLMSHDTDLDMPQRSETYPQSAPLPGQRDDHSTRPEHGKVNTASLKGDQVKRGNSKFTIPTMTAEMTANLYKPLSLNSQNQFRTGSQQQQKQQQQQQHQKPQFQQQHQQQPQQMQHQQQRLQSQQQSHQQTLQQNHIQQQHHSQQQYYPANLATIEYPSNISDLSSMMFPSADPFAYPNQPMTTLEHNYAYDKHSAYPRGLEDDVFIPASTAASNTVSADEHVDVQLFAPDSHYLIHNGGGQAHHDHSHASQSMSMNTQDLSSGGSGPDMWNDQMRLHGMSDFNYEDMFGTEEEWGRIFP